MTSIAHLRFFNVSARGSPVMSCEEPDLRSPQVDPPGASSRKNKAEAHIYYVCNWSNCSTVESKREVCTESGLWAVKKTI